MAAPIQFESSWKKAKEKQELRDARQKALEKAKERYEREKMREDEAHTRGDDVWMLPELSSRLEEDKKIYEKSKKKKKKEKKKHKKEKKKKKKKAKKEESGSSSDSDSDSESEDKAQKSQDRNADTPVPNPDQIKGPKLQRDDWMTAAPDFFPSVSRQELREREKKEEKEETPVEEKPGQHARELNPYWKDGGSGLPSVVQEKDKKPSGGKVVMGDCGLGWLKKAYQRCERQAEQEGRTLEEVAAERYGSLQNLKLLIADAERKLAKQKEELRRGNYSEERPDRQRFQRPSEESSRDYPHRRRSRSRSPRRQDYRRRSRSRSPESRDYRRRRSSPMMQPKEREREKPRFLRPGETGKETSRRKSPERKKEDSVPAWKKKSFVESGQKLECVERAERGLQEKSGPEPRRSPVITKTTPDSSSSSSSSESGSEAASDSDSSIEEEPQPSARLTEQEMNDIGAKIVKAELMGNQKLCDELKAKLEAARTANAQPLAQNPARKQKSGKTDEVVVLSRTDRHGMSRPLPQRAHPQEPRRGRRKREKIKTHGDTGERERYFQDDDAHDLKSLVARERLGTTQDQNLQFAKLAGRVRENVDDDEYNLDDAVIQRASKKQSESRMEDRERHLAILEHQKMTKALKKCPHCFENVQKHLIVAIGMKVYLALPPHRSLAEGHCLIVPMQHVTQSTVLDEDVWHEIQVFRKGLTAMFREQDEDCVFMETCMRLNHFPHMAIECIPLPRELGDMAPIYFKKAIQECEKEWSQNQKVVDLSKKNIRSAVPKGFPYFSVDFGLQGGYAHVIEDEKDFPSYFGREIVGGMLDKDPSFWRKPHKEYFEQQRSKVMKFAKMWKPYDWTRKLREEDEEKQPSEQEAEKMDTENLSDGEDELKEGTSEKDE